MSKLLKRSSSRPPETARSRFSWTRWWRTRQGQRRLKRQEPLLSELRLLHQLHLQQVEKLELLRQTVQALAEKPKQVDPLLLEQKELLLEVLNSLQPSPQGELSRMLGLPTPQR